LSKSCQKDVKKVGKKMAKLKIGCKKTKILKRVGGGEGGGGGGGEGDLYLLDQVQPCRTW
jgi:hypothetical protein